MKEYHPVGVMRDASDTNVAFLLRRCYKDSLRMKEKTDPLICCTASEFEQYVREGKVQFFEHTGHGPEIKYSEEELAKIHKLKAKSGAVSGELYWDSECVFNDAVLGMEGAVMIALVCCRKMKLANACMLQGAIYSPGVSNDLASLIKSCSLVARPLSPDFFLCNWERSQFDKLVEALSSTVPTSICTRTMRRLHNTIYATKMLGFSIPPEPEVLCVADTCDALASHLPSSGTFSNAGTNLIHNMTLG